MHVKIVYPRTDGADAENCRISPQTMPSLSSPASGTVPPYSTMTFKAQVQLSWRVFSQPHAFPLSSLVNIVFSSMGLDPLALELLLGCLASLLSMA